MREAILEIAQLRFAWPRSSELCLDIAELRVAKGGYSITHFAFPRL